jgi:RNA polymerase sigma-70 factor (ECF subfamily)
MTLSEVELAALEDAERTFQMDEEAFRAFYERTSHGLWVYLARSTGDAGLADDLLQETYYRFLRVRTSFESDDHRRNYLFRIAANLIRDDRRRARGEPETVNADGAAEFVPAFDGSTADRVTRRVDLARALRQLKPRERSLLWLAYAQGLTHAEMAAVLGLKIGSLKALLYRARQRMIRLLRGGPGA